MKMAHVARIIDNFDQNVIVATPTKRGIRIGDEHHRCWLDKKQATKAVRKLKKLKGQVGDSYEDFWAAIDFGLQK